MGNPPQPPRIANEHTIEALIVCLHDLHGGSQAEPDASDNAISTPDDITSNDQASLTHFTKCKPLPPVNIKSLLSPAANSKSPNFQMKAES